MKIWLFCYFYVLMKKTVNSIFPISQKKKKNDIPNYKGPRSDDPVILLILYIQDDDMTLWHRENIHCTCRYEFFENEM